MTDANKTTDRRPFDATLPGWPQWVRVPWLRGIYWPICRVRYGLRDAWRGWRRNGWVLVHQEELLRITTPLEEHPDGYDGPCMCSTCRSYADG